MKCQILFSRKNKENVISLLSAECAHSIVNINYFLEFCIFWTAELKPVT